MENVGDRGEPAVRHYLDAERQGREATARWLAHPAAKQFILRNREKASGILDIPPVDRFTRGQEAVTRFTLAAPGLHPVHVDGTIEPSVLDPGGWTMTDEERGQARNVAHAWGALLTMVAATMAGEGVPIRLRYSHAAGDRNYRNDLVALGELLALPVDLDLDPHYIAHEVINTAAPVAYLHPDIATVLRDERPAAVDRTAMHIQRHLVKAETKLSTFPEPREPDRAERAMPARYSREWKQQLRRRALQAVCAARPEACDAATIYATWPQSPKTVGGAVRELMEVEMNPPGVPPEERSRRVGRPSERTLRRDLHELGLTRPGVGDGTKGG